MSEKSVVNMLDTVLIKDPLVLSETRCVISRHLFLRLRYMFETAYGLVLKRDLCGGSRSSLLPLYGFPRHGTRLENAVYVNCPPSMLSAVIRWLRAEKVVCLIIVPFWQEHLWYICLLRDATHKFTVSVDDATFTGSGVTCRVHAFIMDTRYVSRATDMVTVNIPSVLETESTIYTPHQVLGMQSAAFLKARPRAHLSVAWFLRWGKTVPPPLLRIVLVGTHVGFRTHYRGGGEFLRNYASELKEVEEEKAIQTAQKAVKKGWAAGPFDLPPFPNPECAMYQNVYNPEA